MDPELYVGREQTYVKHLFLNEYLGRVAWNIYSFCNEFVYVDGFSGPWKSAGQDYEDTSFKIALDKLRNVRQGIKDARNKDVTFRCLFIEKDPIVFQELSAVVRGIDDVNIKLVNAEFEDSIDDIIAFTNGAFSLVFIDPTGWQGYPMQKIEPLLKMRGEVLINFMSDFINRFIEDPRPEIAATFDDLFGPDWYPQWKAPHAQGLSREAAAIATYTSRLKRHSNFNFVTSTRVLKPVADRSYFYLIYGTQHWKGIAEFRKVEQRVIDEQERVRNAAKYSAQIKRTGQKDFFGEGIVDVPINTYEDERKLQMQRAHSILMSCLTSQRVGVLYEDLLGSVLETPMVWEDDLKKWIDELRKDKVIAISDWTPRRRVPRPGDRIILTT